MERILPFDEALAAVLEHARSLPQRLRDLESVPLLQARDRVLGATLLADRDQPPFPRSTRDGYALHSGDPAWDRGAFRVIGSVRAGENWNGPALSPGEAVEIMTGAPVPPGADAVLMVEHASVAGTALRPQEGKRLQSGENVVPRGAEAKAGQPLLPQGRRLGAAELAVAASAGARALDVLSRPEVAIVATGDELVELEVDSSELREWQIRNSNSYALAALVSAEGGEPQRLPIACDTLADLRERIAVGRMADLLLLSGGVSMGKYDLVEQVLMEAGADFIFTGALIQPGKPIVFGRLPRTASSGASAWTYFFGLPGNPVSTQVCFHLFVTPLLRALAGQTDLAPRFVEARLTEPVKGAAKVARFLPAELAGGWDGVTVRVVGWQGSGDVAANARGNCYAVLPTRAEDFATGETVRVLLR